MKKRILSLLLTIVVLVSHITPSIVVSAVESFSGGSGTYRDPYLISTYEDLIAFAGYVNGGNSTSGKYFKLTNDIIVNDTSNYKLWETYAPQNVWTPIGTSSNPFRGTFDGNGCYIKGLYINSTSSYQGLFGYIYNATVKNVTVSKSYIKGNGYTGGIVGYVYAHEGSAYVQNCHNKGMVDGSGGIIGYIQTGVKVSFPEGRYVTVSDCSNTGNVKGASGIIGGISTGVLTNVSESIGVRNCHNKGNVNGGGYAGGIVGDIDVWTRQKTNISISNCSNVGQINGNANCGGIVGNQDQYEMGDNCTTISNCYNTGAISGTRNVGGIVGYSDRSIIGYCYNSGNIRAESAVGGIVGNNYIGYSASYRAGANYCYNVGLVIGKEKMGGIVGTGDKSQVNSCYKLASCVIGATNTQGTALTLEQMKLPSSYSGWSIPGTWELGKAKKYQFPTLRSNPHYEKVRQDTIKGMIKVVATKNGQEVGIDNAVVAIYEGAEALTDDDVTVINVGGGWYDLQWHRNIPQNATISAYTVVSTGAAIDGDGRNELFKEFGYTESGEIERYILELHSETLDDKGNWCGLSFDELAANGNTLTLKEPRLKVNLAVCYYLPNGTSDYYGSVESVMRKASGYLAQATDGHVFLNKVYIFDTNERKNFYNTKNRASMADIRIETADINGNGETLHANASVGGFYSSKTGKENFDTFNGISEEEIKKLRKKQTFRSIQIGLKSPDTVTNKSLIEDEDFYAKTIVHELGHYLLGFYDEYETVAKNDKNKQKAILTVVDDSLWWAYKGAYESEMSIFGLMNSQNVNIEASSAYSYAYLQYCNDMSEIEKETEQYYNNKCSAETQLTSILSGQWNQFITNEYDAAYSQKTYMNQPIYKGLYVEGDYEDYYYDSYENLLSESNVTEIITENRIIPLERTEKYDYAENIQILSPDQTNRVSLMSIDEEDTETISINVTTDGYLYESDENKVQGYVIPANDTTYTFVHYNDTYTYEYYTSVNQATEIMTANGVVTTKGELYSVASIEDNIDYSSVSWFVKQNDEWKQLETRLSAEENDNIGATCDFVGDGLYVLMAKGADTTALTPVTDIKAETGALYDTQLNITFNDTNENTAYYKIYCSENSFSSIDDSLDYVMYPKNLSNTYTLNLSEAESSFYCGVVAITNNGASSTLSEVVNLTKEYNDSDNDGIPDYWCSEYLLWGLEDIAGSDSDGDGLTNLQEYNANTNPLKADTDGDSVNDKKELDLGLNPLKKMSDGITPDAYIAYGSVDVEVSDLYITPYSSKLEGICDFDTTMTIKNNSEMNLDNVKVQFFFDNTLMSEQLISLEGREEREIDFIGENVQFPAELTVKVVSDNIDDSNTNNNLKTLELTGGVDLSIKEKIAYDDIFKIKVFLQNYFAEYNEAYLSIKLYDNNGNVQYSAIKEVSCKYGCQELEYIEAIKQATGALKVECALYADSDRTDLISKDIIETEVRVTEAPVTDESDFVFDAKTQSITEYTGADWYVNIPEKINGVPVVQIGESVFGGKNEICGVKIPRTVSAIGDYAFMYCSNLVQINIPSSVNYMGYYSLYKTRWFDEQAEEFVIVGDNILVKYNGGDTEVVVPEGVKQIFHGAFSIDSEEYDMYDERSDLVKVSLPDSVEVIGEYAFGYCTRLVEINIPDNVKKIGKIAFLNCYKLERLILPADMESIGERAFLGCSALSYCNLPENLKEISPYLFSRCRALQDLTIPDTVVSIGERAFEECDKIIKVSIPESVTAVGKYAFAYCNLLEEVSFSGNVSLGEYVFYGCSRLKKADLTGVEIIPSYAFYSCSSLSDILNLDSVEAIHNYAFKNSTSLAKITIPASVTMFGNDVFGGCNSELTIFGYSGSVAESYAIDNGISFVSIGESKPAPYSFGQSVQIGLIEPWFIKANLLVYTDSISNPIDYGTLVDYGAYFIRKSELSDSSLTQSTITNEDILSNPSTVKKSKHEGTATIDGSFLTANYDKGIYTYEMSDSLFVLFYVEDENGIQYAPVRERNIKNLLDERKNNAESFKNVLERNVYDKMSVLETDVGKYRAQFSKITKLPDMKAPKLSEYVSQNGVFEEEKVKTYTFGNSVQLVLVEPWGLKVNALVQKNGKVIDYNAVEEYGAIVFYDTAGKIAGETMTAEELRTKRDAYVFSSKAGDATIDGSFITAVYNKGIYTYQLDSNAYVMFYVKDADGYHYGDVKVRNAYELAKSRGVDTSGNFGELEKIVYQDMENMYETVTAYRDDYFSKN